MLGFLKAHQEHYLGYMANKLEEKTHKILEVLLLQSSVLGKKRENSTNTYWKKIQTVFYAECVEKEGSKADGGKNKCNIS